jgi:hypothetical protein
LLSRLSLRILLLTLYMWASSLTQWVRSERPREFQRLWRNEGTTVYAIDRRHFCVSTAVLLPRCCLISSALATSASSLQAPLASASSFASLPASPPHSHHWHYRHLHHLIAPQPPPPSSVLLIPTTATASASPWSHRSQWPPVGVTSHLLMTILQVAPCSSCPGGGL